MSYHTVTRSRALEAGASIPLPLLLSFLLDQVSRFVTLIIIFILTFTLSFLWQDSKSVNLPTVGENIRESMV